MRLNRETLAQLVKMKAKFAMSGAVATSVDFLLYLWLVDYQDWTPVPANIVSYSCAVVLNFMMQKRFVFQLQGSARRAFLLSVLVSIVGLSINTGIVYALTRFAFFMEYQVLTKLIATGVVFFYNFYLKRYVFERKFI
ncbi:MAG: GtrA family protein [Phaeodactylibacter sp.]|uniref:GtrA family protein n=1 Tax=Phaeodactylibacter sp. TaxID=1940289 RepID=UPI0032F05350